MEISAEHINFKAEKSGYLLGPFPKMRILVSYFVLQYRGTNFNNDNCDSRRRIGNSLVRIKLINKRFR